uniref:glycerol kinase n=1 Tax=uncultured bacterium Contigcl_1556 TaxID=1393652 RepID=W0FM34_9BACT|nr:carbohydrate kinase, FGGY-like protein [uncultured bacterium Contigcl_1556]
MVKYVLSVDQSTQGTKAMIFDEWGRMLNRADLPHKQIVNDLGWVSHDPEEIYRNTLKVVRLAAEKAGIDPAGIACMGISNQRETTVAWDKNTGKPVCDAIVWQCARAVDVCAEVEKTGIGDLVREHTGIPISPYFPAAKMAWILQNVPEAKDLAEKHQLCLGTIDAWLVWKLTGQYKTDYSNASRTQLFNIRTLQWDREICAAFGVDADDLPAVTDSDAVFGETDLGGWLPRKIPICGVLGDSHAALFGHGCLDTGMTKATYGTGSSIMMNIGPDFIASQNGLVTSLAWKYQGWVSYAMEGNLNYTGAVITWLKDSLGLIASAGETEAFAKASHSADTTCLVPAFTGLGAPYWKSDARAMLWGMSRTTGRNEIVRAALDSIAFQIHDVITAMEKDTGICLPVLWVDGGATRNKYLMQFQSDILNTPVSCPEAEELSGIGAAMMAGLSRGFYDRSVFHTMGYTLFEPMMKNAERNDKLKIWQTAISRL